MANTAHVQRLTSGVLGWNRWRRRSEVHPDLSGADLSHRNLSGANLINVDFTNADLSGAILYRCDLEGATFYGTSLREANLHGATATAAVFEDVDATGALLVDARLDDVSIDASDFSHCNMRGATFYGAVLSDVAMRLCDLTATVFIDTVVRNCDFSGAVLGRTTLASVFIHGAKGLDSLQHRGPSSVGIDTFLYSDRLPEGMLRGVGMPDDFIGYAGALLSQPIEYYSCFISYSSSDEVFAHRLHADLQERGIRTWFAPEDLRIGDRLRTRIDESIRVHEKVVVVLSRASIGSTWVEKEVETAFSRERRETRSVLFPIRIDDAVFETAEAWAADLVNMRHIGDFRDWKNHDSYVRSFDRLVRDLKKQRVREP